MKILIIGSNGMLGRQLAEVLSAEYEVVGWDIKDIDITKQVEVQEKVTLLNPEVIINCAAYNDVDKAEQEPEVANLVNGTSLKYLSEVSKGKRLLIHFSSDYVFDGEKKDGYKEDDLPNPVSVYGQSKLLGEQMVQENASRYYIIRVSRLFGKPGLSENAKKSFVDKMLELSATMPELKVIDQEVSSPTYVKDVSLRVKEMIETAPEYGIYHLTNSGGCTWYQWALEAFKIKGLTEKIKLIPVPSSEFPRSAKRPEYSILINTKLEKLRSWQDALKEYLS